MFKKICKMKDILQQFDLYNLHYRSNVFMVCGLEIAAGALLLPILWKMKKVVGILLSLVETNQHFI